MALSTGLKALKRASEAKNYGPRTVKLKDGQSVRIRFLQELDDTSPRYSVKNGLAILGVEHSNPNDWTKKALCSFDDEGACVGCERNQLVGKGSKWYQKQSLYINTLVTPADPTEEPYVAVFRVGAGPKSTVCNLLIGFAEENDSITDLEFVYSRKGSGISDTVYTLTPKRPDATPYDVEQHEVFPANQIVNEVPYDQQDAFYGPFVEASQESSGEDTPPPPMHDEW